MPLTDEVKWGRLFQKSVFEAAGITEPSGTPDESDAIQYLLALRTALQVFLSQNTVNDGNASYDYSVVLQRDSENSPIRFYLMPNGNAEGNTKSALKLFFDDFTSDPANYRDFNVTLTHNFNGGVVSNDDGDDAAVVLNMKTLGSYRKQAPDVVFAYNDAVSVADIGCRMVQFFDIPSVGIRLTRWIFGTGTKFLSPESDIAFFEGNLGVEHGSGLRLEGSDGVGNSTVNRLNGSNELEDQIRAGFTFVRDQYGRSKVNYNSTGTYLETYSASLNFNIQNGGYQKVFLTGDTTIGSVVNVKDGDELTLHFTADASNRTITWPESWLTDSTTLVVNANTTRVVKVRYDGNNIVIQSISNSLS